ncbi:26S proteasome regulatory subunit rpn6, partial [Tulasnella sp. 408]
VVDIDHVAEVVGQGRAQVEAKLSQMILDKILSGVLDQGRGCLIIFDPQEEDALYGDAIKTIEQVGKVVDSLYAKLCLFHLIAPISPQRVPKTNDGGVQERNTQADPET